MDGSFVEANAAKESRIPREQLATAAEVHHTVRQYQKELQEQNPVEEPVREQGLGEFMEPPFKLGSVFPTVGIIRLCVPIHYPSRVLETRRNHPKFQFSRVSLVSAAPEGRFVFSGK